MVECRAVYSFKPKEPDELEFNQGDTLYVKVNKIIIMIDMPSPMSNKIN